MILAINFNHIDDYLSDSDIQMLIQFYLTYTNDVDVLRSKNSLDLSNAKTWRYVTSVGLEVEVPR